jgi:hypothetical protein
MLVRDAAMYLSEMRNVMDRRKRPIPPDRNLFWHIGHVGCCLGQAICTRPRVLIRASAPDGGVPGRGGRDIRRVRSPRRPRNSSSNRNAPGSRICGPVSSALDCTAAVLSETAQRPCHGQAPIGWSWTPERTQCEHRYVPIVTRHSSKAREGYGRAQDDHSVARAGGHFGYEEQPEAGLLHSGPSSRGRPRAKEEQDTPMHTCYCQCIQDHWSTETHAAPARDLSFGMGALPVRS